MKQQIVPARYVRDTIEMYLGPAKRHASPIYLALLAVVTSLGAALPLIRVPVTLQAPGSVRPTVERHALITPAGGRVEEVRAERGASVRAGDTLVILDRAPVQARAEILRQQIDRRRDELIDLNLLIASLGRAPAPALHTRRLIESHAEATGELRANRRLQEEVSSRRHRSAVLAAQNLVPSSDVEALTAEVELLHADSDRIVRKQRAEWSAEEAAVRERLESLMEEARRTREEADALVVRAPASGTLEELVSLSPGSYLAPGATLGTISPASGLIAEVWITPRDVGLVRPGDSVRVQVHAFDPDEWGTLSGELVDVSDDFLLVGEQPFFRARVRLDRMTLTLRSGAVGRLRKGMTLTARFQIAERSLWQLLWDRLDDWIDPRELESGT